MNQSLVNELIELGAIQFNFEEGFTYASGKVGPIYCDTRKIVGDPKVRDIFVSSLVQSVDKLDGVDAVGAMATGAISLGAILADRLDLPFFYVRSVAKSYGKNNQIEGLDTSKRGVRKVILFEDLINSGGSVAKGASAVKKAGYDLIHILSLVDYSFQKSKDALRCFCPFSSLIDFETIISSIPAEESDKKNKLVSWHKEFYN